MPIDPRSVRTFRDSESGATVVIIALCLTVLIGFVAFGVDIASLYRDRAYVQSQSDLTALGAVTDLDRPVARAEHVMAGNDVPVEALTALETGRYLRNPAIPIDERFTPLPRGSAGINAVAVTLNADAPLHFARIFADRDRVRVAGRATATRTGAASFSLDSRLIRLDAANLNALFSEALGVEVSLTAGEYQVLADARFDMAQLLEALASQIAFDGINPAEIVDITAPVRDIIAALRGVTGAGASAQLGRLGGVSAEIDVAIFDLVSGADSDLGLTTLDFLGGAEQSALDVLLGIAGATAGQTPLDIDVGLAVPGVLGVSARAAGGEPPARSGWIALGEEGVTLHRADARLQAEIEIAPDTLGLLGAGVEATRLTLPVHAEIAGATATLDHLACGVPSPDDTIAEFVTSRTPLHPANGTSVAALYLGALDPSPFTGGGPIDPANLGYADFLDLSITIDLVLLPDIEIDLLTLQIRSHVAVGQSQVDRIAFTQRQWQDGDRTAYFGSGDLLGTAVADLLSPDNTDIRVKPGQGGLSGGLVAPVLTSVLQLLPDRLLTTLLAPVDGALDGVLAGAGLHLGEGELTLSGYHCETVQLVR